MRVSTWVNRCLLLLALCFLAACGGSGGGSSGGNNAAASVPAQPAEPSTPSPATCSATVTQLEASDRIWPASAFSAAPPQSHGLCPDDIDAALDYAFADGNDTGAVLVIKDGYLVAERYATDRNSSSLVTSWSVAKSVTSTLVGAALDAGDITSESQPLADFIPAWRDTPRAAITVEHLLTVRTALALLNDDDGDGVPDGGPLYAAKDQLALSLDRPLIGTPGEKLYSYSNADVMIAGEVIRVATGTTTAEFMTQVFGNVGFGAEWWTDASGQVASYCCLDATPADFARFGLLMARRGMWEAEEILSDQWWSTSTAPARSGSYGYFWWPVTGGGFAALGVQGQAILIYPDHDLVILRFGRYTRIGDGTTQLGDGNYHQTTAPGDFEAGRLAELVLAALEEPGAPTVKPPAPVANPGLSQVAEIGSRVTLAAVDEGGSDVRWYWTVTDPIGAPVEVTENGRSSWFTASLTGQYTAKLTASDVYFQRTSKTIRIDVTNPRSLITRGTTTGMWPSYGGNLSSNKHSPLAQINADNLDGLEVAWRWRSPDNDLSGYQNSVFEPTPLMVDGVLYTSTSFSQVAAIDATTGKTLWTYNPRSYEYGRPPNNGFLHRGVSYSESTGRKLIHMATGDARLIALDATSGEPVDAFGDLGNGSLSLLDGLPRLDASTNQLNNAHNQPDVPELTGVVSQVGNTSPGIMCRNTLIVGSSIHDGIVLPPAPPGDVRGFDPATGELLWTFHTVPRAGEFGTNTWEGESWREHGNTNVWAPMSADEALGMVYLPVSCPTNNYYGGRRPGDNLFANSVVALDCETGERVWHFQTVHHDIWDYDLPAAPNLMDLTIDGNPVQALAQVSKQGFVYVFDRATGEPVWPIPETPVPTSSVPGEITAPTQPIPSRPPPFVHQGSSVEDLLDPASAANLDVGPLYTPPSERGLIVTPGEGGGANWGGASFNPTTGRLYVNGFGPLTYVIRAQYGGQPSFYYVIPELFFGPETPSPWPGNGSMITAYDMNAGNILWQVPGSSDPSVIGNAASMVSGELLYYKNSSLNTLNVFKADTGVLLREVPLGGRPTGSPMTYLVDGTQYIVVALGRQDEVMELVALKLAE